MQTLDTPTSPAADRPSPARTPFAVLAGAVVRHPWRVIVLWVVAAFALVATSPGLPTTSNESSFLPSHYESIQASDLQAKAFPQTGNVVSSAAVIVFARHDGAPLTSADSAAIAGVVTQLNSRHVHNITSITLGEPSQNGLVQTATLSMPKHVAYSNGTTGGDTVKALRADIRPLVPSQLTEGITGPVAQQYDSQQSSNRALKIVLLATLLLILVLLFVIFRSPIIALMPILTIAVVSQVANGLISDVNKALNLNADSSISTILIVVLFGIGTDYILFVMFRYRERLRGGESPKDATVSAVARAGEAIASAAGVVVVAFLALVLSSLSVFRAIGPALAIAVAVMLVAALTLVPAVVSLLGTRVFWPSRSWQQEPEAARFARIGRSVAARPAVYAAVAGIGLLALGMGTFGFKATFDLSSAGIPKTAESQTALVTLEKGLPPGATDPTDVLLHSVSGPLSAAQLSGYGRSLAGVAGVGVVSPPKVSPGGTVADYTVVLTKDPASTAAVNLLKTSVRPGAHAAAPPGTVALVGGTTSVYADIQRAVNHDYAVVFPAAAIVILLILGLMLRSAVAPWYLMVSVGLGFLATLGTTVLVFQGLANQSGLVFILPVYMYVFVVALGTDYNILMIARLREETKEGYAPRHATALALQHTGPTIAAAGLILAGTFASLILGGNSILAQVGFAVSCGIALAAFVVAMFFTPSVTALAGRQAWWPRHLEASSGGPVEAEPARVS